jgi:two-component system LytT family sensor kinase
MATAAPVDRRPPAADAEALPLRSVAIGALLCLGWTLVGTLSFSRQYFDNPRYLRDGGALAAYAEWLTCYVPWGLLSVGVFAIERRFPLFRAGWGRNLLVLAAWSVPLCYAGWILTWALGLCVEAAFDRRTHATVLGLVMPAREFLGHSLMYWSAVAASTVLRLMLEARAAERRASRLLVDKAQLETSLRQAELDALRMRLQPHFLFNSLQNISVLIQHDPATGSRMLTKLGDLLRASLATDREAETPLRTEIALTQAYLAVEQMRFGDRLSSTVDVDPQTEHALVPTFLLQPLVENALRHGLQGLQRRGALAIRSARERDRLVLTVRDNGVGLPEGLSTDRYGIGLGATCERLSRIYGDAHGFAMRALPEGGTEVRITLPFTTSDTSLSECAPSASWSSTTSR